MFYYKTSVSKKAVFLEKIGKTPFVGGHNHFEGRKTSGDKNQYNLFVGISILNIFYLTTFSKKSNVFQNVIEKLLFFFWGGGGTIFEGTGVGR